MIALGSLGPDTSLTALLEAAASAEAAVSAAARLEHEREWIIELGPAVFATYSQAAVNAANIVAHASQMIAANPKHAPLLVREVRHVVDQETKSLAALDARIQRYAAKMTAPELKASAQRMAEVSAPIVATWQRMLENFDRIAHSLESNVAAVEALEVTASHQRWKRLASRIEELQRRPAR